MRAIDVMHKGREKVICCWEVDGVLIDPGPGISEPTLLEALDGERPRALLLTHIHFDHAGVTGALVRRWPDLPVYVHERGAPHMVDPSGWSRARAGCTGERTACARCGARWSRCRRPTCACWRAASATSRARSGSSTRPATPPTTSAISTSRAAGRSSATWRARGIPPHAFTVAPTPPPDIDVAAWERSIATIRAWEPVGLGMTHFGPVEDVGAQLDACLDALHPQVELEATQDEAGFVAVMTRALATRSAPTPTRCSRRRRWTSSTWGWPAGARSSAAN